jgi:hypothetical protein
MINIVRPLQSPASLQTQAVKDYLDKLAAWKKDSTLVKPEPKPSYRNEDVIEALDNCFFSKCYLTEEKFFNTYKMDVEHFLPKSEYPELRYEWTNLYPADHDANMMKPLVMPQGGYLNPCNPNDDVENDIAYSFKIDDEDGLKCYFEARDLGNIKAINTASLLRRLHNGHDKISIRKTRDLRFALLRKRDKKNF